MNDNSAFGPSDRQIVHELCHKHRERITGYFRSKGCSVALADDLAQEVFIRIFRSCTDLSSVDNQKGYMWRTAFNVFIDYFRSKAAKNELVTDSTYQNMDDDSGDSVEIPISLPSDSVEYVAAVEGLRGCVARCFNQMAQSDALRAEALRLSAIEGWDVEQIREFLNKPTRASVSTYLNQTRNKLKPCVEKCNDYVEVLDEHRQ